MTADEQQKIIKSARAIREHLHALGGPDLSDLSDNELVEKFTRVFETMTSALKNAGITFQQAAQSMLAFSKAYHRTTNTNPVITRVSVEKRVH